MKKTLSALTLFAAFAVSSIFAAPALAAPTTNVWYNCKATSVFEFYRDNQHLMEVGCSNAAPGMPGVTWVAIDLDTPTEGQKNRFLSMATAAILSGKTFRTEIAATPGCGSIGNAQTNCVWATTWALYP